MITVVLCRLALRIILLFARQNLRGGKRLPGNMDQIFTLDNSSRPDAGPDHPHSGSADRRIRPLDQ